MYILIALYPLCESRVMVSAPEEKVIRISEHVISVRASIKIHLGYLQQAANEFFFSSVKFVTSFNLVVKQQLCFYFTIMGKCPQTLSNNPSLRHQATGRAFFFPLFTKLYLDKTEQCFFLLKMHIINKMLTGFIWQQSR